LIIFTLTVKETTKQELKLKDNNTNLLALVKATLVRLNKTKTKKREEKRQEK